MGVVWKRYSFVAKMPKMYSSEDLERFYFDYQTEWMPRGMSIQAYCSRNNVPDRVLDRWIRDIYKRVFPSRSPELLRNSRLRILFIRRQTQRKRRAMRISASRSLSVRVPAWNCHEMGWTTGVSGLSLKDWRICYAEHNRNEQVLLHQELYWYALQVQQDPSSDPESAWKGTAELSEKTRNFMSVFKAYENGRSHRRNRA